MKLPENHVVCGICREIIPIENSKDFVDWIEWGSFSALNHYEKCCKNHILESDGTVPGRKYA